MVIKMAKINLDNYFQLKTDETLLKEAREVAGLTQQEMSDQLGIPKRTIENWEAGVRRPTEYVRRLVMDKLESMAKGTGCNLTEKDFIDKMIEIAKDGYEYSEQLKCVFFTWAEFFNVEADSPEVDTVIEIICKAYGCDSVDDEIAADLLSVL